MTTTQRRYREAQRVDHMHGVSPPTTSSVGGLLAVNALGVDGDARASTRAIRSSPPEYRQAHDLQHCCDCTHRAPAHAYSTQRAGPVHAPPPPPRSPQAGPWYCRLMDDLIPRPPMPPLDGYPAGAHTLLASSCPALFLTQHNCRLWCAHASFFGSESTVRTSLLRRGDYKCCWCGGQGACHAGPHAYGVLVSGGKSSGTERSTT